MSNKKDYEDIIKGIGFMKKYKRNIMIKVAGVISELIITFIPIYLISSLLLFPPLIFKDFIKFTGLTILVIVIVNIIFYIIAAIAKIFIKTAYIITSDSLITQINNEVHSTIYLKDVYYLTYNFGAIDGQPSPTELVLFDKEHKYLISIENPPLLMVINIKKKCLNAKITYFNSRRIVFFLVSSLVISIIVSLISLIAN